MQTILQLAVMGKLVPQDPNDEPASDLMVRTLRYYLGVEQFFEINAEFQEFGDERHRDSINRALSQSKTIALKLVGSQ